MHGFDLNDLELRAHVSALLALPRDDVTRVDLYVYAERTLMP